MNASECRLCPRNCGADRSKSAGFCGESSTIRISRAALHMWEEPVVSAERGSGAVFFTGCNLRCIFCQNAAISEGGSGREVTPEELADIFFSLKDQGAHNINLVTPTHFVPEICEAIRIAKDRGFTLPFVYNSSAYESIGTLRMLDGLIDVYLPDFKYMYEKKARNYSNAPDYPEVAKAAITEMFRQVGRPVLIKDACSVTESDIIKRGVIVRHLVLPLGVKNACAVIDYLSETYGDSIYISIMNQYTPLFDVPGALRPEQRKRLVPYPELHRKVTKREYGRVIDHCLEIGLTNVFVQEDDASGANFIPTWNE
ncbi:MAG: radical SAM protein [Lachnospiraceae bacterium]|nr:radical SAM protein [Lachnospiraceae bacterium]